MRQHHAVGHDLRAGAQLDDVVEHQLVGLQLDDLAVAHDVARGALTTRSWSSTRLARSSWTTPITLLATITPPNNASFGDPARITSAARIATMKLIGVNTLARTIWPTLRVGALGISFDNPLETRSLTSAAVSPVPGSVRVSVTR